MEREVILEFGTNLIEKPKWAWNVDTYSKRLYFASEKELNWFILTWGS
jgi:hypothetical protein